jgi:hypothetical protein
MTSRRNHGRKFSGPEPVMTTEELAAIGQNVATVVDKPVAKGEKLTLDGSMRVGTIALVASTALGFGHATSSPAGTALLSSHVINAAQALACGLSVVHVVLAVYTALVLAPSLSRDPALWTFKVLLSGPMGLVAIRKLGQIADARTDEAC